MTVISSGPWLIGYDTKICLWCAYHKDNPTEEWNSYTRPQLMEKLEQFDNPARVDPIVRQVVTR